MRVIFIVSSMSPLDTDTNSIDLGPVPLELVEEDTRLLEAVAWTGK